MKLTCKHKWDLFNVIFLVVFVSGLEIMPFWLDLCSTFVVFPLELSNFCFLWSLIISLSNRLSTLELKFILILLLSTLTGSIVVVVGVILTLLSSFELWCGMHGGGLSLSLSIGWLRELVETPLTPIVNVFLQI